MLRSLSAAVSGLRNQQTRMDVIGNNVSNVNTVAFKAGRVTFKEGFAQLVESASRPTSGTGGTNPMQVGLGSQIGSIDTMFTQGNLETTGQNTDLAIQGNAFFVVKRGARQLLHARRQLPGRRRRHARVGRQRLRRTGPHRVDGKLTPRNRRPQDSVRTDRARRRRRRRCSCPATSMRRPRCSTRARRRRSTRSIRRSARCRRTQNSFKDMSITVYDSLGTKHELKMVMWKTGANKWDWKFDQDGHGHHERRHHGSRPARIRSRSRRTARSTRRPLRRRRRSSSRRTAARRTSTLSLDLGTGVNGLSQFAGSSTAVMRDQDGYTNGTLQNFSIDATGTIVGGVHERHHAAARTDRSSPTSTIRQVWSASGDNMYSVTPELGRAGARLRGRGFDVEHRERCARDVERRSRAGVHEHDRRAAWLPGERPRDHDEGSDARGVGGAEAVSHTKAD